MKLSIVSDANEFLEWLISQKEEYERRAEREYILNLGLYDSFMETAKMYHKMICKFKTKMEHAKKLHLVLSELKSKHPNV